MAPLLSWRSQSFLLLSLLMLGFHSPCSADDDQLYHVCENTGNYTGDSTFQANLNNLLTSLSSRGPPTGYYNDTVGGSSDRVHGLALCRGDTTEAQCRDCLAAAVKGVVKVCPYRKGATIWYDTCHLRYSHKSFFGSPKGQTLYMSNVNNVSDPASFGRLVGGLLDGLTKRAAYGSLSPMFAAGDVNYSGGSMIYGLAQCTRDLSAGDCHRCLRGEMAGLSSCCSVNQGARAIGGSCNLRYELYLFYNATAAAANQPPLASPPLLPTPGASPASAPAATVSPPPASAATVDKAIRDLPRLLAFYFFLLVIAWKR